MNPFREEPTTRQLANMMELMHGTGAANPERTIRQTLEILAAEHEARYRNRIMEEEAVDTLAFHRRYSGTHAC